MYRPGGGLTYRRLAVLISGLASDSLTFTAIRAAEKKAQIPTPDKIRARADYYRNRREGGS